MNALILDIPMRAFSVNHDKKPIRLQNGQMRLVKSNENKDKQKELEMNCLRYNRQLKDLGSGFSPKLHFWRVHYFWIYEEGKFWTKEGTMSQGLPDCDNPVKMFQDTIFSVIGLPDAYVADSAQKKLPGKENKCVIHVSFHPWSELLP